MFLEETLEYFRGTIKKRLPMCRGDCEFVKSSSSMVDKIVESHLEALKELKWLKSIINNVVEQIPLNILDRPLK